jgi:ribosomal protein S13
MPTLPQTPSTTPTLAPQATPPSLHARLFDGILKTMSGGPVMVTDPVTGQRRQVPQSRSSMGKAIVAAALSGMLVPNSYRETPYGPTNDYSATGANAAQAGKNVIQNRNAAAQKQIDDMQTRKLMTIQNNAKLVQLQAASAHTQHEMLTEQNENAQIFKSAFDEYEKTRTSDPNAPKAFLQQGLSADEVTAPNSGHKLTDSNVIMDGTKLVFNSQTQQEEEEPTYAILNPDLKNIQLPKEVADKLAEVNSQFKDIHAATGGNVRLPVNAYVSAMHDYQAVTFGENLLNTLGKEILGDKAKDVNLAPVIRKNRNLMSTLYSLTQSVGAGNTVDNRPDNILDTLLHAPNGGDLLNLIGMTPEDAQDYIEGKKTERLEAESKAKAEGLFAGAGAKNLAAANAILANPNSTPEQISEAQKVVDLNEQENKTKASDSANARIVAETDEPAIEQQAKNIVDGDITKLKDITSYRGAQKTVMANAIAKEAQSRGLDPADFSPSALETKANMYEDYSGNKKGSTGQNIVTFDTFLGHVDDALDATDSMRKKLIAGSPSPIINRSMNWIMNNAKNDTDFAQFQTALEPVRKEFNSFLNANRAEHESDIEMMKTVTSDDSSPAKIEATLKQLAKSADIRLAAMGRKYLGTMGTTYPNLVSDKGKAALQRLGVASQSIPLSIALPRGNGQPLTDPAIAKQFVTVAGGNNQLAQKIAKTNGWTF